MNQLTLNLLGLSRHEPALADRLARVPEEPGLELFRGPGGEWSARRRRDGAVATLHSPSRPLDAAVHELAARGQDPSGSGAGGPLLVLGLGLGWTALAAARTVHERQGLVLADPSPGAFRAGLGRIDLGGVWALPNVRIHLGSPNPTALPAVLAGLRVAAFPATLALLPEAGAWVAGWQRLLREAPATPAPDPDGLPDWLVELTRCRLRGELA